MLTVECPPLAVGPTANELAPSLHTPIKPNKYNVRKLPGSAHISKTFIATTSTPKYQPNLHDMDSDALSPCRSSQTKTPQKPRTKSTHVRRDILVFGFQIISEDLKFITEEERQIYEDSPKSEQVTLHVTEKIKRELNIPREPCWYRAFSVSKYSMIRLFFVFLGSLLSCTVLQNLLYRFLQIIGVYHR
ncbi:hypothetical protein PM082_009156 [Marasmius tenuissimus]|nr:hypothetical protein PM082_009156 [Marasmius tenuissimus]